ncbi:putative Cullin binding [Trypanosoma vivax]|nr:hypothetical protein TRVL_03903 [Trypanosoma vivax]KAH8620558.1 putative Cullin binding [Trypanosoma vivax]
MFHRESTRTSTIEALFGYVLSHSEKYENEKDGVISLTQLPTLAEMLGVSLDDTSMYRLAWAWSCGTPLTITKSEFVNGTREACVFMKSSNVPLSALRQLVKSPSADFELYLCAIRGHLDAMDAILHKDMQQFRLFYRFIFRWVRAPETTVRGPSEVGMNVETAVELWRMLFPEYQTFKQLDEWVAFCSSRDDFGREIVGKDLWEQLLEFTTVESYSTYDVNDAWPSAMDDFVQFYNAKMQSGVNPS